MTFKESVRICLGSKYLFKFGGRASRSEYWWFALFIFLVNLASAFFFLFPPNVAATLFGLVGLALFPASLGVTVRRFHDRNLSGWWLLAPAGLLVMVALAGPAPKSFVTDVLSFGMSVAYLIILCMPGTPGPNKYGPDPLEPPRGLPYKY